MNASTSTSARAAAGLAACAVLACLSACSTVTSGMGGGDLVRHGKPAEPVLISWSSQNGGISGSMTATLPDATYQGPFFQITQQTVREGVAPLWDGWTEGWTDWPYWGWGGADTYVWRQFSTRYSGKVLANLHTPGGRHMRCRLHMADPVRGMAGGGDGECQLQGGGVIHARF